MHIFKDACSAFKTKRKSDSEEEVKHLFDFI